MSEPSGSSEVVMFMSDTPEQGVCKEMMFSEFEAVLDGVVGLDDFADQSKKGVFIMVNGQLQATACCLFLISFDKNGYADKAWNIPLRHLAEMGGMGPDMGVGSIRLACRTQCSVAWHQGSLWDPGMKPGANTFVQIRDAITRNKLCLVRSGSPATPLQQFQDFNQPLPAGGQPQGYGQPAYQQQPVQQQPVYQQSFQQQPQQSLQQQSLQQQAPHAQQQAYQQPPAMAQAVQDQMIDPAQQYLQPISNDYSDQELQSRWKKLEADQRNKIAKLIKAQRLHIATLDKKREEQVAEIKYNFVQDKGRLEGDVKKLRQQIDSLHQQNMAVREQNEAQRAQIKAIDGVSTAKVVAAKEHEQAEIEALTDKYEKIFEERVNEETAKLKEEVQLRDMELMYRHEVTKQLREELTLLRKDKIRLVNSGADQFLGRLEALGISFIAFHPGAGHISIPLTEMSLYMDGPIVYAANKCKVTEEQYCTWLGHYENPVCTASFSKDSCCNERVTRVNVPSEYAPGESDRCTKHK